MFAGNRNRRRLTGRPLAARLSVSAALLTLAACVAPQPQLIGAPATGQYDGTYTGQRTAGGG